MSTGLAAFTFFHVALSLLGIFGGFAVILALLSAKYSNGWTATFLVTTAATSVTGFLLRSTNSYLLMLSVSSPCWCWP